MAKYPNSLSETTQNLADLQLDEAGTAALEQLAEKGYEVHAGLTPEYADAIVAMALEPAIREYCPNDYGARFASREAAVQWLEKGRAVFLLLEPGEYGTRLAGYGWVGPGQDERVPGGETTFAIRIGEIGQGKGLAAPFTRVMLSAASGLYDAQNIWLETWQSNGAAVHIYHKVGFNDVAEAAGERPTSDGATVSDTRLYMKLG